MSEIKTIIEIANSIQKEQIEILTERDSQYGQAYNKVGSIMQILFPYGITIYTTEQHQQFDLLKQVIGKLARFSHQFPRGIHRDSLIDAGNYINLMLANVEQKKQSKEYINSIISSDNPTNEIF
jgi:hypothetical protein